MSNLCCCRCCCYFSEIRTFYFVCLLLLYPSSHSWSLSISLTPSHNIIHRHTKHILHVFCMRKLLILHASNFHLMSFYSCWDFLLLLLRIQGWEMVNVLDQIACDSDMVYYKQHYIECLREESQPRTFISFTSITLIALESWYPILVLPGLEDCWVLDISNGSFWATALSSVDYTNQFLLFWHQPERQLLRAEVKNLTLDSLIISRKLLHYVI